MPRQSRPNPAVPLRLYVLGAFRLERNKDTVRLPTRKTESLLAYLALAPRETPHMREKLAALFWGDSSDALARSSLRRALVLLRQAAGDALLLTDRAAVQLNPECPLWVDALEFRSQAERLLQSPIAADPGGFDPTLYRDDLLVDYYDDWITPLREYYRSLFTDSMLKWAEHARARDEYDRAAERARQVLQRDAANEAAHRHLMFCYWKMGQRSAALQQFVECARVLEQELGAEPAIETVALYDEIRAQSAAEPEATEAHLSQLPVPLTTLVGRGRERAEIKRILPTTRLLTLTGAGGSGKTRLALQTATDLISEYPDAVGWIELAELTDASLLPHTVAQSLGIDQAGSRPLVDRIARWLHPRPFLLVLDNCEHLVEACAALVETLLRQCPQLKILATSRQVLDVEGETAWIVPSLAMPEPDSLEQNEAVELFSARARAARPDFALTEANHAAVDHICRRLDGIPLAIELAASRIRVLTVEEIQTYLDTRLEFLAGHNRSALPRHRTLRAAIDWSYGLISDPEKILFRRLAVFAGGWTVETATRVCGDAPLDPGGVLMLLSNLVDKSLIRVRTRDGISTYHLLETIREYARERLQEAGEAERVQARHLACMIELAQTAQPQLVGAQQLRALLQLEAEQDNVRAALQRALDHPAWNAQGVRLASLLWRYWHYRGEFAEGRGWLERTLASHPAPRDESERRDRAAALDALGLMVWLHDDYRAARVPLEQNAANALAAHDPISRAYNLARLSMLLSDQGEHALAHANADESVRLFEQGDDAWGLGYALFVRGHADLALGHFDSARRFYEASVDHFRALGERWGMGLAIGHLGLIAFRQGDDVRARQFLSERLAIGREFRSRQQMSYALVFLARVCLRHGEPQEARPLLVEGLQIAAAMGTQGYLADMLEGLAELAAVRGQNARAVHLLAAAAKQRAALPVWTEADQQREYDARLNDLRARLSETAFDEAWAHGQSLPLDQVIRYALAPDSP